MPCYSPLTAYYGKAVGASGKRPIVFSKLAANTGVPLRLPCGQCIGCRLDRSRQWAVRCMHEKQVSRSSSFLTLTYNDDHMPVGGTLVKRDMQLFMKRLRKEFGDGVRFYGCGEYGEHTGRPHYHILLYNISFDDKRFLKMSRDGKNRLYTSAVVDRLWPFGFNVIGDVDYDSAAYVARYIVKKITGKNAEAHYSVMLPDGQSIVREAEFTVMSRRPGIGSEWFARFGAGSYAHDNVIFKNKPVRPPRFYDGRYEIMNSSDLERLKIERCREAMKYLKDNTSDRRRVKEAVARGALSLKKEDL